jgi:hypothetical protein
LRERIRVILRARLAAMAAAPWDNERIREDFRRLSESNMVDANGQAQRRLEAKAAGRLTLAYEMNHDEASAKAYVYGHTSDTFQSREQLLAELRTF